MSPLSPADVAAAVAEGGYSRAGRWVVRWRSGRRAFVTIAAVLAGLVRRRAARRRRRRDRPRRAPVHHPAGARRPHFQ